VRWQKALRLGVAAVGLGTAAAVYVLVRPRPAAPPPAPEITIDPAARVQTGAGKYIRTEGDRVVGTWTYSAVRQYADGRSQWDHFRYELSDGGVMSADLVQAEGQSGTSEMPAVLTARGHVVWQTHDGTSVQADAATFDDANGVAIMTGPTTFTRGRTTGSGVGGVYEQKTNRFTLQSAAHVTTAPADAAGPPLDITAQSMLYVMDQKTMTFDGAARIVRASETLASDHTTIYLAENEEQFKAIQLRGHSAVTPAAGHTSDLPEMQAEDIDLSFYPDSTALQTGALRQHATMVLTDETGRRSIEAPSIDFATAEDGRTLTRLDARDRAIVSTPRNGDVPERKISANSLVATGDAKKGLTQARFEGKVEFNELVAGARGTPDHKRTATSETLTARIAGRLDAIDDARFERDVVFRDGTVTGDADVGIYRAA
jgi:lipopolysaccharide export system protein LptA